MTLKLSARIFSFIFIFCMFSAQTFATGSKTINQGDSPTINWTVTNGTATGGPGCQPETTYTYSDDGVYNAWQGAGGTATGAVNLGPVKHSGTFTFDCKHYNTNGLVDATDSTTLIVNPQPPIVYSSAQCNIQPNGTYNIILQWSPVSGITNYPQRLSGPSHATGDSGGFAIQHASPSEDDIGMGQVGDAPTNTSLTWTGITTAGTYNYWGHTWSSNGGWSAAASGSVICQSQVYPDLTAGDIPQSTGTVGTQISLTSTISNLSSATGTGTGFYNLFQYATSYNSTTRVASGITDMGTYQRTTALGPSGSFSASLNYTPASPGTFYVRACADKSSASDTNGSIVESNDQNNCGNWLPVTVSCPTGTGWNGTSCVSTPVNNATCTNISAPTSVTPGQSFSATVVMNNSGNTTWTSASNYNLGSQSPQDNTTWGTSRVPLPSSIAPGSSATFTRTFTAPNTIGSYTFAWKMVQDGVEWFGATCSQAISVSNAAINGTCSNPAAHYTCSAGTSINNAFNGSVYSWQCQGSNGGTTASCQESAAPVVNGSCSATHYSCTAGTSNNNLFDGTTYTWTCDGSGGGTTASCSETPTASITVRVTADTPLNTTPSSTTTETFTSRSSDGAATACRLVTGTNGTITGYSWVTSTTTVTMKSTTVPATEGQYTYGVRCRDTASTTVSNYDTFTLNVCNAGRLWNNALATCALPPDLTASATTPATGLPNASIKWSSTITNLDAGSTGGPFYVLFQTSNVDPATDPQGKKVNDAGSVSMAALPGGSSVVANFSKNLGKAGTYYMRACADKRNKGDAGVINETDENNNCGDWTAICIGDSIQCPAAPANPQIVGPTVLNNNTPNGTLQFSCLNSTVYSIVRAEGPTGIYPINNAAYSAQVNSPVTVAGNYTLSCSNGSLSDSAVVSYSPTPSTPSALSLSGSPRTIEAGGKVTLTWSITNPNNSCAITATPVCAGTCTAAQNSDVASLQSILTSGSTDQNDPNGVRTMTTALHTAVSGTKALGKKTLQVNYTTDFTLKCGASSATSSVRTLVSKNNEG